MFGVESKELLIILFAVLILFGPKRIPEVARALGKGLGDVRDALSGIERDVRYAADSWTAPETRPTPGVGAVQAAPLGRFSAGRVLEGDRVLGADCAPSGDRTSEGGHTPGGDHDPYGDQASLDHGTGSGPSDAPTSPAGATSTEGAIQVIGVLDESDVADGGVVTALRPEPNSGPGLAG